MLYVSSSHRLVGPAGHSAAVLIRQSCIVSEHNLITVIFRLVLEGKPFFPSDLRESYPPCLLIATEIITLPIPNLVGELRYLTTVSETVIRRRRCCSGDDDDSGRLLHIEGQSPIQVLAGTDLVSAIRRDHLLTLDLSLNSSPLVFNPTRSVTFVRFPS